jgi:translation initiation factor 2B subunit (eIF-2B alpha/beta/delta family)
VGPLDEQVSRIAVDRTSGASAIFESALEVLETAFARRLDVTAVARALVRAQPSMAPVWRVAVEALAALDNPDRFARFAMRARRAPAAHTRVAVEALAGGDASRDAAALHIATLSCSGAVAQTLKALAARGPVRVSCAEGRPALEGRRLAADLAAAGIPVTFYGDAAIGDAVATASAVVVGADAIAPDRFVNKVGTGMLAAAALLRGVPVYVLGTREKFVDEVLADRLLVRDAAADEIWPESPAGVHVRNPCFEPIPLDLVSGVITDAGAIGPDDVAAVCASTLDEPARAAVALLIRGLSSPV